jgi:hypothetical protein
VPIDIAVIEFDRKLVRGTFIKTLHGKSIYVKERSAFAPGDDIIVLGFPRGLSDRTHNLALMRNALIASPYGINFRGEPEFLVDANLHPGMSGSPVMTKPRTMIPIEKGGVSIYQTPVSSFLGVFSATLSWGKEALGLGEVWYADLIEEIIEGMKLSPEEE